MNKFEKIACFLLGAALMWYLFIESPRKAQEKREAEGAAPAVQVEEKKANAPQPEVAKEAAKKVEVAEEKRVMPSAPEKILFLENDEVKLELSSWGGVVKKAIMKKYARDLGEINENNPAVTFDFASSPLGAIEGVKGAAIDSAFDVISSSSNTVVFANGVVKRTVTLDAGYLVSYADEFVEGAPKASSISLGVMAMGNSKNDLLSVDSLQLTKADGEVIHHGDDDTSLTPYLVGGLAGGCSGSKSAAGMPQSIETEVKLPQKWIAVKNRFFVSALASSEAPISGFSAVVTRDLTSADYKPSSVAVKADLSGAAASRVVKFYVGPKKQSLLWDLGMKDVMEFGMWRWICYPIVWVLNFFNGLIPNFGVAIILLTILVRLIFWPLTHKSTVGMKKMQELQPKMKALQAKFKDNPQRLQQETWALYREEKVNPLSSCLPMLVQIPVFIALFNVLRSAVELRYAPFLWIGDLSEPEGLFAAYLPFGGLNLLPILMALTTALQSAFTPSSGDKNQQKMMMVIMPVMMLVMFYSFPSALSLYWFLSNVFSIVQMWLIRRKTAKEQAVVVPVEVIDPPQTRQMRRHGVILILLSLCFVTGASARTFTITAWRGETVSEIVPDSCEIKLSPSPLTVKVGAMLPVKYVESPHSLQLRERYDRVSWGSVGAGPRVVEVSVPADAKSGVYKFGMMEVKVLPRVLPPPSQWKYYLDLWQHPWAIARIAGVKPFSKEHYAAMRPVYELLATAGQKALTVSLLDEPWDHQCRDAYYSMVEGDFKLFDEYVEFGRSCGLGPDISCYTLCPWNLKEKPGTKEFEERWAPFIRNFASHLKEKGWFDDTIISMDEREPEQVKAVVDFVRRHAPGMRIAMAGNRKPSDFHGIDINIYSQILNHVTDDFLKECKERSQKGFKTTFYVCCGPIYPNTFMTSANEEPFWLGVYPAISGLDGFLRWAWNSWPQDPLKDASFGSWRAGDTFLVYPGAEPSWRFLQLRNGIVAAEKIRILRADPSFTKGIEEVSKKFVVNEAVEGKTEWWRVKDAVLSLVNRE